MRQRGDTDTVVGVQRVQREGAGWEDGDHLSAGRAEPVTCLKAPTSMGTGGLLLRSTATVEARASALNSFEAGPTAALPVDAGGLKESNRNNAQRRH